MSNQIISPKELSSKYVKNYNPPQNNATVTEFEKFLKLLRFDMNKDSARLGIYILNEKGKFQWITSTPRNATKPYQQYQRAFLSLQLEEHLNASNKNKPIKRLPRYKNYSENDRVLINKYKSQKALNQTILSDILCIDIDLKNGLEILDTKIIPILQNKPVFTEQSNTGRIHAYFKLDSFYTYRDFLHFQRYIRTHLNILEIDIRHDHTIMRLPFSLTYTPIKLTENGYKELSTNTAIKQTFKNYNKKNSYVTLHKILTAFNNDNIKEITKKPEPVFSSKKQFNSNTKNINFPTVSNGTRHQSMCLTISYALHNNIDVIEAYQIFLNNHDGTSKDLNKWSGIKSEQVFYNAFSNMKATFNPNLKNSQIQNNITNFISTPLNLDQNTKHLLNSEIKYVINQIKKQYTQPARIKEIEEKASLLYFEIIKFIIFDTNREKQKNKKNTLTSKKFNKLKIGTQITRTFLNRFKKDYNVNFDIHNIFNQIIKYSNLLKQIKHNNLGYCFNPHFKYSRQWILTNNKRTNYNIKDIINIIIKNINKIKENINNITVLLNNNIKRQTNKYIMFKVLNEVIEVINSGVNERGYFFEFG